MRRLSLKLIESSLKNRDGIMLQNRTADRMVVL